LAVIGSARKAIVSDLVTCNATVTAKDPNLLKTYDTLKTGSYKVKDCCTTASLNPTLPSPPSLCTVGFHPMANPLTQVELLGVDTGNWLAGGQMLISP